MAASASRTEDTKGFKQKQQQQQQVSGEEDASIPTPSPLGLSGVNEMLNSAAYAAADYVAPITKMVIMDEMNQNKLSSSTSGTSTSSHATHQAQDEILATLREFYGKGIDQAHVLQDKFQTTVAPKIKEQLAAIKTQISEHKAYQGEEHDARLVAGGALFLVTLLVLFIRRCLFGSKRKRQEEEEELLVHNSSDRGLVTMGGSNSYLTSNNHTTSNSSRYRADTDPSAGAISRDTSRGRLEDESYSRRGSAYSSIHHHQHGGAAVVANGINSVAKNYVNRIRGPQVPTILYHTWTPPTPWTDASKQLLPTTTTPTNAKLMTKSQVNEVTLELDFAHGTLHHRMMQHETRHRHRHLHHPRSRRGHGALLTDVTTRVKRTTGAVLEIYFGANKDSSTSTNNHAASSSSAPHVTSKMEHTFESGQEAAQFQHDLLAFQIVGKAIQNIYHSLELIHRGSEAHEGTEPLLHDSVGDKEVTLAAVAWDDVYRCLYCFPRMRASMEEALLNTNNITAKTADKAPSAPDTPTPKGATTNNNGSGDGNGNDDIDDQVLASVAPEYQNKRNMLGHVDLFRIFVPPLPPGSLPQPDSSPERLEPWIALRKQVATASLYVQAYVRAKCVVNMGWHVPLPGAADGGNGGNKNADDADNANENDDMTHRLAFDEDSENGKHDATAKHEYYEPIVSRDVLCEVHTKEHLLDRRHRGCAPSDVQAYSLVGTHSFQLPPRGEEGNHPLEHDKDPIESIPSLRRIVENNPELEFFCIGFFPEGPRVAIIYLFVRTLPKGMDIHFDTAVERFAKAEPEARNRRLAVFLQLGPGGGLSPMVWAGIKAVSTLLSWTRDGDQHIPVESGGERTQFPGILLDNYMKMSHFGGGSYVKTGYDYNDNDDAPKMPINYIAATAHCDAKALGNMVFRILYQRLEDGALPASIVDFSFVLEGREEDELPERVLGSVRMVHCDPIKRALPIELSAARGQGQYNRSVSGTLEVTTSPQHSLISATSSSKSKKNISGKKTPKNKTSALSPNSAAIQAAAVDDMDTTWGFFGHKTHKPTSPRVGGDDEKKEEEKMPEPRVSRSASLMIVSSDDNNPHRSGIDALIDILDGVQVPVRKASVLESQLYVSTPLTRDQIAKLPQGMRHEELVNLDVLETLNRGDLGRYYAAADCDLKIAAVNLVESTAWRGRTFPIDIRTCRIELHSGQFFQQGKDLKGHPVFYFRNMCVGPWRQNVDAVINAVLHRLETGLANLPEKRKITLVILLGKPHFSKKKKRKGKKKDKNDDETRTMTTGKDEGEDDGDDDGDDDVDDDDATTATSSTDSNAWNSFKMGVNPRLQPGEDYHVHTNQELLRKLIDLLMTNYPERLHKAIFVPGHSRGYGYSGTAVGMQLAIRTNIKSPRTRTRCFVLHRVGELKEFIHRSQIVTIAGGDAVIREESFASV